RRRAARHGGGWARTTLGDAHASVDAGIDDILALDEALETLDPRQRRIVEMRWFAGMTEVEIAAALDVSEMTVRRDWTRARARLNLLLQPPTGDREEA